MKTAPVDVDFLIRKAIAGDRVALETLLVEFHDPLRQYIHARRLRHNISTIADDDVLQETLLEAFRNIKSLEPQGPAAFFAWLKTVARTRMINMIKAQKAQKRGGLARQVHTAARENTVTTIIHLLAADGPTPSQIVRRKEMVQVMGEAVADLKTARRQIMEMRYGEGLSIEQIGAKLGLAKGAVKMHIQRSIKELREVFAANSTQWTRTT